MVDRLKTTESISQGAGAFALSQTPTIDPACIKQLSRSIITTMQTSFILLSVVLSATQEGNKTLARLANYAAPMPKEVRSVFYGSNGR